MTSMVRLRTLALGALLSGAMLLAYSQDDSTQAPPPGPPSIGSLSGDFSLVKKFTYLPQPPPVPGTPPPPPDAFSSPSNQPVEDHLVQTGSLRQSLEKFVDGSSLETWSVQIYRLSTYSAHPQSVIVDVVASSNNPNAPNQYRDAPDFPELAWLPRASFQGVHTKNDAKCYVYKSDDESAWIDAATNRPVYLESKTMQVTYTWSSPTQPLQLPKGYTEKLEKFKRALRGQM
jgi:hypothetical protein